MNILKYASYFIIRMNFIIGMKKKMFWPEINKYVVKLKLKIIINTRHELFK
jgi:hypothetical protein